MPMWVSSCLCGPVRANVGQLVCDSEDLSVYASVGQSMPMWVNQSVK